MVRPQQRPRTRQTAGEIAHRKAASQWARTALRTSCSDAATTVAEGVSKGKFGDRDTTRVGVDLIPTKCRSDVDVLSTKCPFGAKARH